MDLLGSVEGDFEVLSSILRIERCVVDRVRKIVMNERTECHSVGPRRREVRDVDMLDRSHVNGGIRERERSYLIADGRLLTPGEKTFFDGHWIVCALVTEQTNMRTHRADRRCLPAGFAGPGRCTGGSLNSTNEDSQRWQYQPFHAYLELERKMKGVSRLA